MDFEIFKAMSDEELKKTINALDIILSRRKYQKALEQAKKVREEIRKLKEIDSYVHFFNVKLEEDLEFEDTDIILGDGTGIEL